MLSSLILCSLRFLSYTKRTSRSYDIGILRRQKQYQHLLTPRAERRETCCMRAATISVGRSIEVGILNVDGANGRIRSAARMRRPWRNGSDMVGQARSHTSSQFRDVLARRSVGREVAHTKYCTTAQEYSCWFSGQQKLNPRAETCTGTFIGGHLNIHHLDKSRRSHQA